MGHVNPVILTSINSNQLISAAVTFVSIQRFRFSLFSTGLKPRELGFSNSKIKLPGSVARKKSEVGSHLSC